MGKPTHLSNADIDAFGRELDTIRDRVMADLGAEDAAYIRKVLKTQRYAEVAGRALLMAGILPPACCRCPRFSRTWRSATTSCTASGTG